MQRGPRLRASFWVKNEDDFLFVLVENLLYTRFHTVMG
jgi:hypothetical protein